MTVIAERARAKVNLTLRIHGRRADGYHLLESLIVFADVGDKVVFRPGATPSVTVSGPYVGAITGRNLVDTTLERLAAADPGLTLGAVEIEKALPIAAGIGGGSADAAAVLRAVRSVNPQSKIDWHAIAASLGADVPVCLADCSALVWGVGEHIEPLPALASLDAVLVCPMAAAPLEKTRTVFRQLATQPLEHANPPVIPPEMSDADALIAHMRGIGNDLRNAAHAIMEQSAWAEAALAAKPGCQYVSLSGAGPTSYGIFTDAGAAADAADSLKAHHPEWWITATTLGN
ncbi:4-(cytidine 5'-diphospho)-2-C-methyl-D-erythritol kinase [Hyphomicrobium sp. NDB2Meth4]|uniref:4-(cytidine 5'-diphospho)-2-C-methyl-D-erythritol kinase n=1 Tax=Hyphomicrobium sp. NDB2Meth4 TaxID=1892846 RepID=UPI0009312E64|nr:4-(cytidine 5'-diphospho)-2-C-methyl-D-erythritol kinase [Hyphomicrobium sp. NDB2Meth4]